MIYIKSLRVELVKIKEKWVTIKEDEADGGEVSVPIRFVLTEPTLGIFDCELHSEDTVELGSVYLDENTNSWLATTQNTLRSTESVIYRNDFKCPTYLILVHKNHKEE